VVLGLLSYASPALAAWGENWGTMRWGQSVAVPTLTGVGLIVLALAFSAIAAWTLRKRRGIVGLPVLLSVPLVVVAGTVPVPNRFANGTPADANQMNANFDALKTAVDDNDSRIITLQSTTALKGDPGPQGPIGLTGADGAAGADGATGAQGLIGLTGAPSTDGTDGAPGLAGTDGAQRLIGLTGDTGPAGPIGPQGPHTVPGNGNTAVGLAALLSNTAGNNNTASGAGSLQSNTTGIENTAVGSAALQGVANTTPQLTFGERIGFLGNSSPDFNTASDGLRPGFRSEYVYRVEPQRGMTSEERECT